MFCQEMAEYTHNLEKFTLDAFNIMFLTYIHHNGVFPKDVHKRSVTHNNYIVEPKIYILLNFNFYSG